MWLDGRPSFNAEQARPAHFLELPLEVTVGPYGRGVDSVYARDRHGGALVSMHWAGLLRARASVCTGGRRSRIRWRSRSWPSRITGGWPRCAKPGAGAGSQRVERQTWYAYELLQALDLMSLAMGLIDLGQRSSGGPIPVPSTLARVEQPEGTRSIPAVPVAPGGPYGELLLAVTGHGAVAVDPYPFAEPSFDLELSARRLEDRRYESADEAARAYHDAPVETIELRVGAA